MGTVSLRLDDDLLERVEDKVEDDDRFENRSQLLRYGARQVLGDEYEKSG